MSNHEIKFFFHSLDEWNILRENVGTNNPIVCICVHKYPIRYHPNGSIQYPGTGRQIWLLRSDEESITYSPTVLNFLDTVKDMVDNFNLRYIYVIDCSEEAKADIIDKQESAQDACLLIKSAYGLR
jgi:hypothetical protein